MKARRWIVIALLLAGCQAGAADTAAPENTAEGAETAAAAPPSTEPSQSSEAAATGDAIALESVGADDRDDDGFLTQPTPLPPGTYRSSTYPVPVRFTTTDELTVFAVGVALTADPQFSRAFDISQPDQVADLSQPISREDLQDAGQVNIPEDRLIDVPDDFGAWLGDAAAIEILDEGSTMVADQEAPWWDLALADRGDDELACEPRPGLPPCQALWPGGPGTGLPAAVIGDGATRVWAVQSASRTVMVVAQTQPPADDSATSAWLDTAEDIVASLEFD